MHTSVHVHASEWISASWSYILNNNGFLGADIINLTLCILF